MHFKFITVTLALVVLGRAASVSPSIGSTVEAVSVDDVSHLSAATPAHASPSVESDKSIGGTPSLKGLSTTSANSAFRALTPNYIQALYVCPQLGCTGLCYTYDLTAFVPRTCYSTAAFRSAYVYSFEGVALPYGVYIGQTRCFAPAQLPIVNNCYNYLYNGVSTVGSSAYIT